MTNPVLDLLTKSQNLILDPHKWTKNQYAKDEDGEPVDPWDGTAVCFCTVGALQHTNGGRDGAVYQKARDFLDDAVAEVDLGYTIVGFNDNHTHDQVMRMWDRARELANAAAQ